MTAPERWTNTVTHVVFGLLPEHVDEAVDFWRSLGARFELFERRDYGLSILFDWDHGLEIIAPIGPGEPADRLRQHLEDHGEGIFTVNFGVANLEEATERIHAYGLETKLVATTMTGQEPWFDRFDDLREARIQGRDDLRTMLARVVPRAGVDRSLPRLSHVGFGVSGDHIEEVRRFWESNFRLRFEEPRTLDPGLRVLYSPEGGIELIAIMDETAPQFLAEPMARLGEGPLVVAFAVDDLETARRAAEAVTGRPAVARLSYTGDPDWVDRYERLEQAVLPELHGMRIVLTEMVRRAV
jgi:hypothetical protein